MRPSAYAPPAPATRTRSALAEQAAFVHHQVGTGRRRCLVRDVAEGRGRRPGVDPHDVVVAVTAAGVGPVPAAWPASPGTKTTAPAASRAPDNNSSTIDRRSRSGRSSQSAMSPARVNSAKVSSTSTYPRTQRGVTNQRRRARRRRTTSEARTALLSRRYTGVMTSPSTHDEETRTTRCDSCPRTRADHRPHHRAEHEEPDRHHEEEGQPARPAHEGEGRPAGGDYGLSPLHSSWSRSPSSA